MKEKIKKYWWVLIIALFVAGSFYWYEWRPSEIRKQCSERAFRATGSPKENYRWGFNVCINKNGLKSEH